MKIGEVSIPIKSLADEIYDHAKFLKEIESLEEEDHDFRLQVLTEVFSHTSDSHWSYYHTWIGDPQYDTDHRGYWGSVSLPRNCTRKESVRLAKDLIEQALEQYIMENI